MIEPISRDKSTLYGGGGGKGKKILKFCYSFQLFWQPLSESGKMCFLGFSTFDD